MNTQHSSPASCSTIELPAQSADYELQARVYALRSLPVPPKPPPKSIRRKPLRPDARLVGSTARVPMAWQKPDAAQAEEHSTVQTQGGSLTPVANTAAYSSSPAAAAASFSPPPPPKSPLRYAPRSISTTPAPIAVQRRRCSQKIHQLMGADIDVFDDSSWRYADFQQDAISDSSSLYSQDSVHSAQGMHSWPSTVEEVPGLESDFDGSSSRYTSWGSKRSPPLLSGPLHILNGVSALTNEAAASEQHPLRRKPRTHRKSRDIHVVDDYHRIVTDIASPSSRKSVPDLLAVIPPTPQTGRSLRTVQSMYGQNTIYHSSGMPVNFDAMLAAPRPAPRPPQITPLSRPIVEERQGSYFDVDSDSEGDEAVRTTGSRGRDSFFGIFLHRSSDGCRSRSMSSGPGRPSSELAEAAPVQEASKKRTPLKGLLDWAKKDTELENQKRRQELKQKITVQGGRQL